MNMSCRYGLLRPTTHELTNPNENDGTKWIQNPLRPTNFVSWTMKMCIFNMNLVQTTNQISTNLYDIHTYIHMNYLMFSFFLFQLTYP
jgi:hypothetical protein